MFHLIFWWCYLGPYVLLVGFVSIYHSYLLQACFVFFVLFSYRYRKLQDIYFQYQLILLQWLIAALLTLPLLILHNFQYLAKYDHSQVVFSNFFELL